MPEKLDQCNAFCEVRRTGYYGTEEEAPPLWGKGILPGQTLQLQEGFETSTTIGIGIGLSAGEALLAIFDSVDFTCKNSNSHAR